MIKPKIYNWIIKAKALSHAQTAHPIERRGIGFFANSIGCAFSTHNNRSFHHPRGSGFALARGSYKLCFYIGTRGRNQPLSLFLTISPQQLHQGARALENELHPSWTYGYNLRFEHAQSSQGYPCHEGQFQTSLTRSK